jgi:hypothetical protein
MLVKSIDLPIQTTTYLYLFITYENQIFSPDRRGNPFLLFFTIKKIGMKAGTSSIKKSAAKPKSYSTFEQINN